jgi:hypothetical protein
MLRISPLQEIVGVKEVKRSDVTRGATENNFLTMRWARLSQLQQGHFDRSESSSKTTAVNIHELSTTVKRQFQCLCRAHSVDASIMFKINEMLLLFKIQKSLNLLKGCNK